MHKVILMMLLAVVSNSAVAEWAQEPSSFMGIALGKPISDSIPEVCTKYPKGSYRLPDDNVDALPTLKSGIPCHNDSLQKSENSIRRATAGSYQIWNLNAPPIKHLAYVKTLDDTIDGAVGMVLASFDDSDFAQVKKMFIIKYGLPHKEQVEEVQTVGGAVFDNVVLTWSGKKVMIMVESLSSKTRYGDYGAITVVSSEYLAKQSQESNDAAKKGAAGL